MFALIKKKRAEKGVNLEEIFTAYDKDRSGHVSVIQFQYVLNTLLDLEVDYVERATEFLGTTQKEINKQYGIEDEKEEQNKQQNPYMTGYNFLSENPIKQEIIPEKPDLIMKNPEHLEYESFKIIDYAYIKQSGQNYFIQLNDDLYKQCRLDGNTKANQSAKNPGSTTGAGKYLSSFGSSNYSNTLKKK